MNKSTEEKRKNLAWLLEQSASEKVLYMEEMLELFRLLAHQIMEEEMLRYAGERYSRDHDERGGYDRYGFNPGSISVSNQRLKVSVPRLYKRETGSFQPLESYQHLHRNKNIKSSEGLMRSVLYGIGTRNYEHCVETISESFGLSKTSVSREFIERSSAALAEFQSRSLAQEEWVAVFIDGKKFGDVMMVVALGISSEGRKRVLDIVETTTENALVCGELLSRLQERGLRADNGLLFIIDGSKGLRKAIEQVYGANAVVQRCQWHKRENVAAYLPEAQKPLWRRRLQAAYEEDDYLSAKTRLEGYASELESVNCSAAASLREGLEETLTLQRLGISALFHRSFATTNCIESLNSMIERTTKQVKYWQTSEQRHRWVAVSALDAERRMRKVNNAQHLKKLQTSVKNNITAQQQTNSALETTKPISTKKKT